jgi:hypothetical protein
MIVACVLLLAYQLPRDGCIIRIHGREIGTRQSILLAAGENDLNALCSHDLEPGN